MKSLLLIVLFPAVALSAQWYVGPSGNSGNPGTLGSPWDIASGFSGHSGDVAAGDTVWILGGTYTTGTQFTISTSGTAANPIKFRAYQRERPILECTGDGQTALAFSGDHNWIWGVEIKQTSTDTAVTNNGSLIRTQSGADSNRVINCYLHDGYGAGISPQDARGTKIYGNILHYNGRSLVGNYNIYAQNPDSTAPPLEIRDNINFNSYHDYGYHFYTEGGAAIDSLWVVNDVHFVAGLTTVQQIYLREPGSNWLRGNRLDTCWFWGRSTTENANTNRFYRENKGARGPLIRRNFFMRTQWMWRPDTTADPPLRTYSNNYYWGPHPQWNPLSGDENADTSEYTGLGNQWWIATDSGPSGAYVFIKRNEYEPNRGVVVIYNFDSAATVTIQPPNGILANGDSFYIYDAQNPPSWWGTAWQSGVWNTGDSITITMPNSDATIPTALVARTTYGTPAHTDRRFGVFLLRGTGTGGSGAYYSENLNAPGGEVSTPRKRLKGRKR